MANKFQYVSEPAPLDFDPQLGLNALNRAVKKALARTADFEAKRLAEQAKQAEEGPDPGSKNQKLASEAPDSPY